MPISREYAPLFPLKGDTLPRTGREGTRFFHTGEKRYYTCNSENPVVWHPDNQPDLDPEKLDTAVVTAISGVRHPFRYRTALTVPDPLGNNSFYPVWGNGGLREWFGNVNMTTYDGGPVFVRIHHEYTGGGGPGLVPEVSYTKCLADLRFDGSYLWNGHLGNAHMMCSVTRIWEGFPAFSSVQGHGLASTRHVDGTPADTSLSGRIGFHLRGSSVRNGISYMISCSHPVRWHVGGAGESLVHSVRAGNTLHEWRSSPVSFADRELVSFRTDSRRPGTALRARPENTPALTENRWLVANGASLPTGIYLNLARAIGADLTRPVFTLPDIPADANGFLTFLSA